MSLTSDRVGPLACADRQSHRLEDHGRIWGIRTPDGRFWYFDSREKQEAFKMKWEQDHEPDADPAGRAVP